MRQSAAYMKINLWFDRSFRAFCTQLGQEALVFVAIKELANSIDQPPQNHLS